MEELIGLRFKRNVYGPSLWTDEVTDIRINWKVKVDIERLNTYRTPKIEVKGDVHWFPIEELIFDFNEISVEQAERIIKFGNAWKKKQNMI